MRQNPATDTCNFQHFQSFLAAAKEWGQRKWRYGGIIEIDRLQGWARLGYGLDGLRPDEGTSTKGVK